MTRFRTRSNIRVRVRKFSTLCQFPNLEFYIMPCENMKQLFHDLSAHVSHSIECCVSHFAVIYIIGIFKRG